MTISFKDKVAIVTGAGGGLGKAYALELAKRGAKVVVNDLGGARDGTGTSDAAAQVVEQIKSAGGEAMANGGSVTEYEQMVEMVAKAKEAWGGVHVLINNAGILRDKSFAKMELADFKLVMDVHVMGAVHCTKAVWPIMQAQNYGRIVMTTSSSGLYGNFGQANYGAAKMALVGLMQTLSIEGAKNDIHVNCLAPTAHTRMTEDLGAALPLEARTLGHGVTSLLVMIAMLASSNAIAPMSREVSDLLCRQTPVGDLTTLRLDTPIEVTPYHLITLSGKRLSPIAARLRELLLGHFLSRSR